MASDLAGGLNHTTHRLAGPDDSLKPVAVELLLQLMLELLVLPLEGGVLGSSIDLGTKIVQVKGLLDEIEGPQLHRLLVGFHRPMRRNENDRGRRVGAGASAEVSPARRGGLPSRGR